MINEYSYNNLGTKILLFNLDGCVLGLKGLSNRRLISMNEVKQHQTEGAMWTVLKGRVYNLSPYLKFHPGGRHGRLLQGLNICELVITWRLAGSYTQSLK